MKIKILAALALLLMVTVNCKKNGTGGKTTISATTKHHDRIIPLSVIYIKYGAKEFPGEDVSKYDASQVTDKAGHTHFENLLPGDYYLYGVGYDSLIAAPVKGGTGTIIRRKDKNEEIDLIVPVTE